MNKVVTLCLGALLLVGTTLGVAGQVHAQDQTAPAAGAASGPFADVPADHWAYQAVDTLQKAGIVIGYPDGTYGGRRAMTRYEFAVAIARLLPLINANAASKSDLSALQTEVENRLTNDEQALDALKSLVDEFQPELQQLGQDVAAVKARLDALEQRVAVLEEEQRRVHITGDYNAIVRGLVNTSSTNTANLDQDGYRVGSAGSSALGPVDVSGPSAKPNTSPINFNPVGDATTPVGGGNTSLWNDINFYQDMLLTVDGRVSDNAHAILKFEGGTYAPFLRTLTDYNPIRENGVNTAASADTFVNIYEAYLDLPVSLGGLSGAEFQVGRVGEHFTKYTLWAPNPDSYAVVPETSTGDYPMDGAKLVFGAGPAHVQLYAAKNNLASANSIMNAGPLITAYNGPFRPGSVNPGGANYISDASISGGSGTVYAVDQSAGARVTFGNPSNWVLGVTGILSRVQDVGLTMNEPVDPYQASQGSNTTYDTLATYGADFSGLLPFFKSSGITINGEFATTPTGSGSRFGNLNSNHANQAYEASLGWATGPFSIKGGYREVYRNFYSAGNWDHIGTWINPVNVKGPIASLSYTFTPKLTLSADGTWYQGAQNTPASMAASDLIQSPLADTGDKLNHYAVGLKYGLTSQYSVDLGYEYDQWQLDNRYGLLTNPLTGDATNGGKPTEQYITIGVGHSFNKNASLKVLYQILDYDDKSSGFDPFAISPGNPDGKEHGGVAITQFSVKF